MFDSISEIVAAHYENNVLEYEKIRLEKDSPVEYELSLRALDRWILSGANVLDVGVGVGHYSCYLAQKGCQIQIVDVCKSFLDLTEKRLVEYDLQSKLVARYQASAENMSMIEDESVDAVLMLGPFYHLPEQSQQQAAVSEAFRVLREGGVLFASAINRLAVFRELFSNDRFVDFSNNIAEIKKDLSDFLKTGKSKANVFPPLGEFAYCATPDEFKKMFEPLFAALDFFGAESFSAFNQLALFNKPKQDREIWFDFLEQTARSPEGIGGSEHVVFVGRKR